MAIDFTEEQLLRYVEFDDHRLLLYDTHRRDKMGKSILGYGLFDPDGRLIFTGEDFGCSPLDPIDSDAAIRSLLGFLTLRDGDVEDSYWEDHEYGELQFEWRDQYAEELQMWAMSPSRFDDILEEQEHRENYQFTDLYEW